MEAGFRTIGKTHYDPAQHRVLEERIVPMKRLFVVLITTAVVGFGAASQAVADDVAVIVNRSNPVEGLTMVQLRKIVLGQETTWTSGKKIAVLMTTPGQPERVGTLKIVCGMSETDFTLHFMRGAVWASSHVVSSGSPRPDPPKTVGSGVQVRQLVAGTADAVGFIKASQLDDSVKVITIDGSGPGQPDYRLKLK
jgi:ABC-type phosphate transport system substrate-binding protein